MNERASAVDMSLPSKLTSYFSAGAPIVAAVPASGGTAAEVRRSGAGVVVPPGVAMPKEHLSAGASLGALTRILAADGAVSPNPRRTSGRAGSG